MSQPNPPDGEGTGLKIFSFVVHLWKEQTAPKRSVWRGSLTDVRNGEKKYFQSLPGLLKTLAKVIGAAVPSKGGKHGR